MLPDAPDVESVVLGENGVMAGAERVPRGAAKPGVLVIDMSTIAAAAARRIGEQIAARGGSMLDAPVSGGDVGAKAGHAVDHGGRHGGRFRAREGRCSRRWGRP